MTWSRAALAAGVAGTVVPVRRVPVAAVAAAITLAAVVGGIVPPSAFGDALDALAAPLVFLLLAVPLAVALDEVGFFASVAALVDGGRHLRLGLWGLAAAVTVLFNLDAAVVLLTPVRVPPHVPGSPRGCAGPRRRGSPGAADRGSRHGVAAGRHPRAARRPRRPPGDRVSARPRAAGTPARCRPARPSRLSPRRH